MDDTVRVRVDQDGQDLIVRLSGEIDLATVKQMPQCLLDPDVPVVTVDLSGVTFMDCRGVTMLVAVQSRARDRGGKLVLYGVQPNQMRLLDILGMLDFFDSIVPDEKSAFAVMEEAPRRSRPRTRWTRQSCQRLRRVRNTSGARPPAVFGDVLGTMSPAPSRGVRGETVMDDGARFTTTLADGEWVIVASGELDMACAGELQAVLDPLTGSVVLDLSAVTFLDSSTISVLVVAQKRLNAAGAKLRIRDPHDVPRRVFEVTGLSMWIED